MLLRMGPPTPPLALSPANLAVLQQQRPTPSVPRASAPEDAAVTARTAPPPLAASGRGRLINILA